MLYLVATPIGNLLDITLRALVALKTCDYILCEDTRHSLKFLNHHDIHRPLKSYHKFNEAARLEEIIEELKSGKKICLISDAGTPCLADPGYLLVKRCHEEKLPVSIIPGPCAMVGAVTLSGFSTEKFQFVGFLPKKEGELKAALLEMLLYKGTSVCYETPHRLVDTLKFFAPLTKDRKIAVVREMTKMYEECRIGTASELLEHYESKPPLGELVLVMEEGMQTEDTAQTPQEHVEFLQKEYGLSQKEAIKLAAELRGVPKRSIYNLFHD